MLHNQENSIFNQQQYETLLNILYGNNELANAILSSVASDNQLELFVINITNSINDQNPEALVETVLQDNGKVAKRLIDLIASNDQLKDAIINSINGENPEALVDAVLQNNGEIVKKIIDLVASDRLKYFITNIINSIKNNNSKALVDAVLQNNGEVAKRVIDLVASDDQLKNAICEGIDGKNPGKAVEKIMGVIMRAINDIENGGKPSTFLGKLNEHKGKIAISVLLTGGAVTAFVLEQPVIGAIAAVAAVIMVGILIREICKQQSATQESTLENTVGSVLDGTTLNPAAGLER